MYKPVPIYFEELSRERQRENLVAKKALERRLKEIEDRLLEEQKSD